MENITKGGNAMAEFCLKCFNEMNGTNYRSGMYGWKKTSAKAVQTGCLVL